MWPQVGTESANAIEPSERTNPMAPASKPRLARITPLYGMMTPNAAPLARTRMRIAVTRES